jgi:hypothetical protein
VVLALRPVTAGPPHLRAEDFAAYGVAAAALVDAQGGIVKRLCVSGTTYHDDAVPGDATGLEALDANGQLLAQT